MVLLSKPKQQHLMGQCGFMKALLITQLHTGTRGKLTYSNRQKSNAVNMLNSQFQHFHLIFFKCLGLNWRKIYNRIKVRIRVLNQIIVIMITIFLLLQSKSSAVYITLNFMHTHQ